MKTLISKIKTLDNGTEVCSCFCVKRRNSMKSYSNGYMFNLYLVDKSGEIVLNYWGGKAESSVQQVFDSVQQDSIIYVSGKVGEFRGKKIDVNEGLGVIRPAECNEYDLADFIVSTNQNIEKMWTDLTKTIYEFDNAYLKKLFDDFFDDETFVSNFKKSPAAIQIHHSCVGGLLEHTWEVLNYCKVIADIHPSLDKCLLLTGAILHDVGKIKSYEVSTRVKHSKSGVLLGHIPIATEMICEKISSQTDFPHVLKAKLLHMILSHHGKLEYGAVVEPKLPEAAALHHADLMSSRITQYIRAKKDSSNETFQSGWNKYIGSVFLE